jgi:hypothetical protein
MESFATGTLAGTGSFRCQECGFTLTLAAADLLPDCPGCGGQAFARASLFTTTAVDPPAMPPEEQEHWLGEARGALEEPGEYLAYEDGDRTVVVSLTREWTRIGRSLAANVRFDDPTVSRRHALVVRTADGVRVLDDRSLNGVFVNGKRVEWSPLSDGDEIVVGRHRLHYLVVAQRPVGAATEPAAAT